MVAALALVTLLLGRVYCSVICPLGVMQDIAARLGRRVRKNRYGYSPERRWLRWGMLALFVILLAVGLSSLAALVAPYSAYGRIASTLLAPVWAWGNNALAYMAERADSYAFYTVDVWVKSWATLGVAVATLVVVGVAGVAQRTHVVQYRMPRGNGARSAVALLASETRDRHVEVQRLRPLRTQLQVGLHRQQDPYDRLFAMRRLHGLHR